MRTQLAIYALLGSLAFLPQVPAIALASPPQYIPDLADRDRPNGRRRGGSSRGNCTVTEQITALVPMTQESFGETAQLPLSNRSYESVLTLTTEPHPSFWFYMPYGLDTVPLEFVLQDANGETLYQAQISDKAQTTGVLQVPLPHHGPGLEANSRYQWYLYAECEAKDPVFVQGWIERTPLASTLNHSLQAALPPDQVALYASHGLWQDAITLLGQLYQTQPDNQELADDWYSLLESVDLADVAHQPLLNCCQP